MVHRMFTSVTRLPDWYYIIYTIGGIKCQSAHRYHTYNWNRHSQWMSGCTKNYFSWKESFVVKTTCVFQVHSIQRQDSWRMVVQGTRQGERMSLGRHHQRRDQSSRTDSWCTQSEPETWIPQTKGAQTWRPTPNRKELATIEQCREEFRHTWILNRWSTKGLEFHLQEWKG